MTNNLTTVDGIIEDVKLREELISRVEVLDKVKNLLLLPNTEFATVLQVADFYEVSDKVIEKIVERHSDELTSDGYALFRKYDVVNLLNRQYVGIEISRGKSVVTFENGDELTVANRGLRLFPRRAILRVGMLLRDSRIAVEVRNQLLNIEAKASNEVKVMDIEEEQKLAKEYGLAVLSGDMWKVIDASSKMLDFKNRHIKAIEEAYEEKRIVHDATLDNFVTAKAIGGRYLLDGNKVSGQKINQILLQQGYLDRGIDGLVATDLGIQVGAKDNKGNNTGIKYTYVMWTNRVVEEVLHPIFTSYGLVYKTTVV